MLVVFFVLTGRNETFPSPPPKSSVTHELTSPNTKKKKTLNETTSTTLKASRSKGTFSLSISQAKTLILYTASSKSPLAFSPVLLTKMSNGSFPNVLLLSHRIQLSISLPLPLPKHSETRKGCNENTNRTLARWQVELQTVDGQEESI